MGGEALHGLPRDAVGAPSLQTPGVKLDGALSAVGVTVHCGGVGRNDLYRFLPTPTTPSLNSEQALSAAASCSAQRQPGCDRDVTGMWLFLACPAVRGCAPAGRMAIPRGPSGSSAALPGLTWANRLGCLDSLWFSRRGCTRLPAAGFSPWPIRGVWSLASCRC